MSLAAQAVEEGHPEEAAYLAASRLALATETL